MNNEQVKKKGPRLALRDVSIWEFRVVKNFKFMQVQQGQFLNNVSQYMACSPKVS